MADCAGSSALSSLVLVARPSAAARPASPLVDAVKRGDREAVRALLRSKRRRQRSPSADGTTALHWAVRGRRSRDWSTLLLQAGANATAANRYGVTPITLAATNGNAAVIDALLKAGADPEHRDGRRRDRS